MFRKKVEFDIEKIEKKLVAGNKREKMFVYTVEQQVFVDREKVCNSADNDQFEYFCKVLEGCGFNC